MPKTAGTSFSKAIEPHLGPEDKVFGHRSISDMVKRYRINLDNFFKFSFVRNPWDRLISTYFYYIGRGKPKNLPFIEEFRSCNDFMERFDTARLSIKNIVMRPQRWWLINREGDLLMDYIAKFENLDEEVAFLCKKLNLPDLELDIFRKSLHEPYESYYNNIEDIDRVAKYYERDIELFDYRLNVPKPEIKSEVPKVHTPLISVAMACYNAEFHIRDAIKSIVTQDYPNWELVIVDDKSKDNSLKIIDQCIREFNIADKTKVFKHDVNCGYGCTLRDACEKSTGELVAIVDSDDALANDKALRVVVNTHKKHPKASMTYSNYIHCNSKLVPQRSVRTRQIKSSDRYIHGGLRISHLKVFKRKFYDKTEGVDPTIRRTIDKDLVWKLEEVGSLVHINRDLYYFRNHPKQLGYTFPKKLWQKNKKMIYGKAIARRKKLGRSDLL